MTVVWLEGPLGLRWASLLVRKWGRAKTPALVTWVSRGRVSFRIPG